MTAIDLDKREVQLSEMDPLSYDYLVLALGAQVNFFGTEGAAEHAFPMYTLRRRRARSVSTCCASGRRPTRTTR